jgi:hypothetical protein
MRKQNPELGSRFLGQKRCLVSQQTHFQKYLPVEKF